MQLLQIQQQLAPLDPAARYSVPEALARLRTSRKTLYELIGRGELRVIKQGRRTYVPGSEIARLSAVPAQSAAA
jgi:excisionase family DNA binding protein